MISWIRPITGSQDWPRAYHKKRLSRVIVSGSGEYLTLSCHSHVSLETQQRPSDNRVKRRAVAVDGCGQKANRQELVRAAIVEGGRKLLGAFAENQRTAAHEIARQGADLAAYHQGAGDHAAAGPAAGGALHENRAAAHAVAGALASIAAHDHDTAAHADGLAGERATDAIAGIAGDLDHAAAQARGRPWAGVAADRQAAALHQPAGLAADVAVHHDLAFAHPLADLIEPVARVLDADVPRVAHAQAERVTDRDAGARGLQLEPGDLGLRHGGQPIRHQRRQVEPLLRPRPKRENRRLPGSSSLRGK